MSRKIIGVTVGTTLPKPNFDQTDPTKGDYIKNKPDFDGLKSKVEQIEVRVDTIQENAYDDTELRGIVSENVVKIDTLNELVGNTNVATQIGNAVTTLESEIDGKLDAMQSDIDSKVNAVDGMGLSTNDYTTAEKDKLATVEPDANFYEHPTHTSHSSGLYKVTVDDAGHVSDVVLVEKEDIVALGIPEQDTTYDEEISDLSDRIDDVENSINTTNEALEGVAQDFESYKTTNNEAVSTNASGIEANKAAIEAIQGDYLTSTDKTQLQDGINEVSEKATANASAIEILNGEGDGSVKQSIDNAFNEFAANVTNDDIINTYKELIDYAAAHGPEFTALVGKVNTIEIDVGEIETDLTNYKSTVSTQFAELDTTISNHINDAQEALDGKADLEHGHEVAEVAGLQDLFDEVQINFDNHTENKENPHEVTAEQIGTYTKDEIEELVTVEDIDDICGSNIVTGDGGTSVVSYATKKWVQDGYQPKGEYLTKVPDGYATESYVNTQISAIPTPDVSGQINTHNIATDAHNDIRLLVNGLTTRLNTLADCDDDTLDQMSEVVEYIKNNQTLIEGITTKKVNVEDIVDNLTTNMSNKPLSAAQGVVLKGLIETLTSSLDNYQPKGNYLTEVPAGYATEHFVTTKIAEAQLDGEEIDLSGYAKKDDIPDALSDLTTDSTHRVVTDAEKESWNAKSNFSGDYNDLRNKPAIPSISGLATENYVDNVIENIDIPAGFVAQDEAPEDTSVLWLDTDDDSFESSGGGNTGGGTQADWNAAEGEPGHVLNRTHYEETVVVENVIMVETEVTTTANASGLNMKSVSSIDTFSVDQFIPGDTYIVEYDGTPYICVAGDYKNGYLGNPVLHQLGINATLEEDNRFPFGLIRATAKLVQVGTSEPGDHTFKVTHVENETVVHKLDSKYLPTPDWNASEGEPGHILNRTHWIETEKVEIPVIGEWENNDGYFIGAPMGLEAGKPYTVTWDGIDYEVTAAYGTIDGFPCVILGNFTGETDEPFVIAELDTETAAEMGFYGVAAPVATKGFVDFGIHTDGEIVHQIESKYVPSPDWNAEEGQPGHVLNRTHYKREKVIILPETTLTLVDTMASLSAPLDFVIGEEYEISFNVDGISMVAKGIAVPYKDEGIELGTMCKFFNEDYESEFLVVSFNPEAAEMMGCPAVININGHDAEFSCSIYKPEKLKQLDAEFIPYKPIPSFDLGEIGLPTLIVNGSVSLNDSQVADKLLSALKEGIVRISLNIPEGFSNVYYTENGKYWFFVTGVFQDEVDSESSVFISLPINHPDDNKNMYYAVPGTIAIHVTSTNIHVRTIANKSEISKS